VICFFILTLSCTQFFNSNITASSFFDSALTVSLELDFFNISICLKIDQVLAFLLDTYFLMDWAFLTGYRLRIFSDRLECALDIFAQYVDIVNHELSDNSEVNPVQLQSVHHTLLL